MSMRVAIVGGGPAGLYFARLLKRARPGDEVVVFEQNAPDATFGFGVGLGGKARDRIRHADPELHDRMSAGMVFANKQIIHLNGVDTLLEYSQVGGAIERLNLLRILQEACLEVRVAIHSGERIDRPEPLQGYDLVVAADGINSAVRAMHGDAFGTTIRHLTNHFAWYGVARAMRPGALIFRQTPLGRFVGHYYAYTDTMSTFVAECDDATWHASGMAGMTDTERRVLMESIFARELQGEPLIENRSIWRQFPAVTNERWHSGNTVLVGDALLSAHFSIGSGTRLAMDDAASLFEAVRDAGGVPAALASFEQRRRPIRERFRQAAENSYNWYERLSLVMDQQPLDFVYDFLTRTGRIDDARMAEYCPGFHAQYTRARATVAA